MCMQNIFQSLLLLFLQQEGDILFQQNNAIQHYTHATRYSLQNRELP